MTIGAQGVENLWKGSSRKIVVGVGGRSRGTSERAGLVLLGAQSTQPAAMHGSEDQCRERDLSAACRAGTERGQRQVTDRGEGCTRNRGSRFSCMDRLARLVLPCGTIGAWACACESRVGKGRSGGSDGIGGVGGRRHCLVRCVDRQQRQPAMAMWQRSCWPLIW